MKQRVWLRGGLAPRLGQADADQGSLVVDALGGQLVHGEKALLPVVRPVAPLQKTKRAAPAGARPLEAGDGWHDVTRYGGPGFDGCSILQSAIGWRELDSSQISSARVVPLQQGDWR